MSQELLQQLRDIHYPPHIPFWPLAPGWYVVIVLVLIIMGLVSYFCYRSWVKHRLKRIVLQRIQELELQDEVKIHIAAELSVLLKRAALASYPRSLVAGLFGEDWLKFLDQTAATTQFTQGSGRLLIVYPYQPEHEHIPSDLFHLIKEWVKKNL
jgi:hypothetical protein